MHTQIQCVRKANSSVRFYSQGDAHPIPCFRIDTYILMMIFKGRRGFAHNDMPEVLW